MITDVYSKRDKALPDVLTYDTLDVKLRNQIVHVVNDLRLGTTWPGWPEVAHRLCREHGMSDLPAVLEAFRRGDDPPSSRDACLSYIRYADTNHVLDTIELLFRTAAEGYANHRLSDAVAELNHRFREHGVGYQFENGSIIPVSSQFVHAEVVRPALALLLTPGFEGANGEFLAAHKRLREDDPEGVIQESVKAFESTMKTICSLRNITYDAHATARPLVDLMIANNIVPTYMNAHMNALIGLVTIGNRDARHGTGPTSRSIPLHMANYALHLAASNIVFLVEGFKALP